MRAELRAHYRTLAQQVVAESSGHAEAVDLPFRLVESVISSRSDDNAREPGLSRDRLTRRCGCWAGRVTSASFGGERGPVDTRTR